MHVRDLPCTVYCTGGYRRGVVEGIEGCMSEICHVLYTVLEGIGGV